MIMKTEYIINNFIKEEFKNDIQKVVRLADDTVIFVDEKALDKVKMADEGYSVKTFGVRYRVMSDDMKTVTVQYLIPNEVLTLAKTRGKEFVEIKRFRMAKICAVKGPVRTAAPYQ